MINARFRALTANSRVIRTEALISGAIKAQKDHVEAAKKRLQTYPPPPTNSKYVRTYTLQRGWNISGPRVTNSGIITTLSNNTPYTVIVHGDLSGEGQVRIHQGRWPLVADVIDREGYLADLREAMKNALSG